MVHETFVKAQNFRWALMGTWQRAQLLALQGAADIHFCSIELWADLLRSMPARRLVQHLPVGSNLPDMRHRRESSRAALGADEVTTVIACFDLWHPERLAKLVLQASEAVARSGRPVLLLNLGQGPPESAVIGGVSIRSPGFLEAEALASRLAASDLFIAAHEEGVSTRRTTMMAALQHAVPVLGTFGPHTDLVLMTQRDALRLVPAGEADAFVDEAVRLAADPAARRNTGLAGRRLYEAEFDWPVITRRMLTGFAQAAEMTGRA
jgi:glycosyltransferase involved in cell wall biosynthesis